MNDNSDFYSFVEVERDYEREEGVVVQISHAIVEPHAMMVKMRCASDLIYKRIFKSPIALPTMLAPIIHMSSANSTVIR